LTDVLNSRLGYIFNDPEYTVASALIPQAEFFGGCKCKTGNPQKPVAADHRTSAIREKLKKRQVH